MEALQFKEDNVDYNLSDDMNELRQLAIAEQTYEAQDKNNELIAKITDKNSKFYSVVLYGSVIQFPLEYIVSYCGLKPSDGGEGMYVADGKGNNYDLNELINELARRTY